MFKNTLITSIVILSSLVLFTCGKDDPVIPNEEEVITTLNYTLTSQSSGEVVTLSFVDLDGDGGDAPTVTGGTLSANDTYSGSIELLNEAESPSEDITEEIEEEDEEHQFFFESSTSSITVAYDDADADGNPIGLNTTVTTGAAGSGSLTVTLRHEPSKSASGVSSGDISNAGGETDIEVTFQVNVQ